MTKSQAQEFIEKVLCKLWDTWEPTDWDTGVWLSLLQHYDADKSEASLRRWYANTERITRKPIPGQIRKHLIPAGREEKTAREPRKEFGLASADAPEKITWFYINSGRQRDKRDIRVDAEKEQASAENLYGGKWNIIEPPDKPVSDGKEGPMALAQAVANIMAGPDTPSKRFLIRQYS